MSLPGSVEGRERLRLFCALRLPAETVDRLERWQRSHLPAGRFVAPDNLHVTLAFLGSRPAADLAPVADELAAAARGAVRPVLAAVRYRETRSVGMVVLDDEGSHATALAASLHERLERIGVYEREQRAWLPHVTVLRFRRRPGLAPDPPDLGLVTPSEVALYHSVLRPSGAQYEIRESVALGG